MADASEVPTERSARRGVRIAVYTMLLASAGSVFLLGDRLWAAARLGDVPIWAPLLPASLFTLFVIVYTIDRWLLVRRRNYPVSRAFFQVAFALVFVSLLWPTQAAEFREVKSALATGDHVVRLLDHRDPAVRAAACELLGLRAELEEEAKLSDLARDDEVLLVRQQCALAFERVVARKRAAVPAEP